MSRKLSSRSYLAVLAIGCILCAVLATMLPHDPYIRYQITKNTIYERTRYQYERLHFDPTPIDVVFIGSSRTAGGVEPALVERGLRENGIPLHIANLSLPATGMDIRIVQAREALRTHPEIRLMIIPVIETFPRDGHQAFGELATTRDILSSHWLINRNLPTSLLRLPMRQMKLFAATLLPDAFGYQARFDLATYAGSLAAARDMPGWQPPQTAFPYGSRGHARAIEGEARKRMAELTPPLLPESLGWMEFGVARGAIEDLLAIAEKNDTRVVFLYLPSFLGYKQPREAEWLRARAPLWIADMLQGDPANYTDAAHLSPVIKPQLNAWLAERIAAEFGGQAPEASPPRDD